MPTNTRTLPLLAALLGATALAAQSYTLSTSILTNQPAPAAAWA